VNKLRQSEFTRLSTEMHVLIVDDDPAVQRMLVSILLDNNLSAIAVSGRQDMLTQMARRIPDLIILDINLGTDNGLEILRELRVSNTMPIILITGNRQEEIDHVLGLELGADDYIMKPFGLRAFLARVRAALRRKTMNGPSAPLPLDVVPAQGATRYRFAGWQFNLRLRELTSPTGRQVTLTKSEFAFLAAFVQAPGEPLSRERLLRATRVHEDVFDRTIDVQIMRLRRKLEQGDGAPRLIKTARGIGYRFDADVEAS
jgi:two-component system, OmpR family, response regulator